MNSKNKRPSKGNSKNALSVFTLAGALECLLTWDKFRSIRDSYGSREESEAIIDQLTGKLTDFEVITKLLNAKEKQAGQDLEAWRISTCFGSEGETSRARRDPSAELIEIHEAYRAVRSTGDPELVRAWLADQPYAVRFLLASTTTKTAAE